MRPGSKLQGQVGRGQLQAARHGEQLQQKSPRQIQPDNVEDQRTSQSNFSIFSKRTSKQHWQQCDQQCYEFVNHLNSEIL